VGWETFDIGAAEPLLIVGTRIIGGMVKRRRERLGLSQRRLAMVVGCDQSVISRLENGKITSMRYRRFAIIVGILGGLDSNDPLPRWRIPLIPFDLAWAIDREADALAAMPFSSRPPSDDAPASMVTKPRRRDAAPE
jgi:transcriptional regulator with XRE-family HTH domain